MFPANSNDLMSFLSEPEEPESSGKPTWRILIVDDEPDVHRATELALKEVSIEGRQIEFVHAYSAQEARTRLAENTDLAVMLLDVVMETPDAGLQLIRHVREELGNRSLRVILRTGQPGYAPEIDTIRAYDINDYKTKSELTRVRLFTSLTVAIRSYWQIHQLEANRRGLEMILAASTDLGRPKGLRRFAEGVVTQLCALLGVEEEGIVCAASLGDEKPEGAPPYILAAAGRYSSWIGLPLKNIPDPRVRRELESSLSEHCHHFGETTRLYFSAPGGISIASFVDVDHQLSALDLELLEVFCSNISVAFENTVLLKKIGELAYEDPLVKLPNRNSFLVRLAQYRGLSDTLALVDIDGFADINSVLDQEFGDCVLKAVSQRLRDSFSSAVDIARIGSDVFGLLGPHGEINAERIESIFASPYEVEGESLRLSATTGLLRLTDSSDKPVELLKNASVALKQAKTLNRGKSLYFEAAHAVSARARMQMLNRLRLSFSAERLFLVYQPFIELATGRIVGAEALLRWRSEQGEFVPPDTFIPLAEHSGLMVPIGDWVIRSALQFQRHLADIGHTGLRMAVNVSHVQFREPDFVEKLVAAIEEFGTLPGNLEIELTESVAIDNIELIQHKLAAVRAAGVAIAIDDFGTGYSSLNIVRQLNVDRLKIDRSFISGKDSKKGDFSIAGIVQQLAGQLGLKTIAEGIETESQRNHLLALGCDDGQGYLFSPPLTSQEFEDFLVRRKPFGPV